MAGYIRDIGSKGYYHGDLSLGNIAVRSNDNGNTSQPGLADDSIAVDACLVDFATLSRAGAVPPTSITGTPLYMALSVLRGEVR